MDIRRLNWPIWSAFLVSVIAFFSYPFFFVRFPVTRDFPWANLLLLGISAVLLVIGLRRAFAAGSPRRRKITGAVVASLTVLVFAFFVLSFFIASSQLPGSQRAPQVGQKAPEFRLADSNGNVYALSDLLSAPLNGQPPKGVLLVFYRGYW